MLRASLPHRRRRRVLLAAAAAAAAGYALYSWYYEPSDET